MLDGNFEGFDSILEDKFGWDPLAAASVWAFGPHGKGTNTLVDYSLDFESDKAKLQMVRGSVVQGFQWATREGPLTEEPMKGVNFKLLGGTFSDDPVYRSSG